MVVYSLGLLAEPLAPAPTASPAKVSGSHTSVDVGGFLAAMAADRRERAGAAILGALDDGSDAVKVAALDAAGRFATVRAFNATAAQRAFERIARLLRASASPVLRGRAAVAIASFGAYPRVHAPALSALQDAFSHEDDATARWHEMWGLMRGFAKELSPAIVTTALRDASPIVRIQALRVIARAADKNRIADVQGLANDPDWRVSEEARETLAVLGGGKRTEHLTAIAEGVATPSPLPEPSETVAPLPRPSFTGKPSRPRLDQLILTPHILPRTTAQMTGPAPGPHPRVRIATTKGTLTVVLFPEWAPNTVANFLLLTNRGYFDGLRWFRIVPDFVVQTGDPNDNGEGDAGYQIQAEENPIEQDSGVISMGLNYDKNGPQRDSAGTQFYITLSPALHLNRDFTVFGRVESGFDVLGRLVESDRMTRVEQIPDVTIPV